jgi:hypothetical protein
MTILGPQLESILNLKNYYENDYHAKMIVVFCGQGKLYYVLELYGMTRKGFWSFME